MVSLGFPVIASVFIMSGTVSCRTACRICKRYLHLYFYRNSCFSAMIVTVVTTCIAWNHLSPSRQRDLGVAIYVSLAFIANKENSPSHPEETVLLLDFLSFFVILLENIIFTFEEDVLLKWIPFVLLWNSVSCHIFARRIAHILLCICISWNSSSNSLFREEKKNKTVVYFIWSAYLSRQLQLRTIFVAGPNINGCILKYRSLQLVRS